MFNLPRWAVLWAVAAIVHVGPLYAQRGLSWAPPPVIGMWTPDSTRIDENLPELASADWPTPWLEWLVEVRRCSRLYDDLREWTIWTVRAPAFFVRYYDPNASEWKQRTPFGGFTFNQLKRIYVVQRALYNKSLIQHEMLHALLFEKGFDSRHNTPVADAMFKRCFGDGK